MILLVPSFNQDVLMRMATSKSSCNKSNDIGVDFQGWRRVSVILLFDKKRSFLMVHWNDGLGIALIFLLEFDSFNILDYAFFANALDSSCQFFIYFYIYPGLNGVLIR